MQKFHFLKLLPGEYCLLALDRNQNFVALEINSKEGDTQCIEA